MYGDFLYGCTELGGLFESKQLITGMVASAQANQSAAVAGEETFVAQGTSAQLGQSLASRGKEIFLGDESSAQVKGSTVASGKLIFVGNEQGSQAEQVTHASEKQVFAGGVVADQSVQSTVARGAIKLPVRIEVGGGYVRRIEEVYGPPRIVGRVASRSPLQWPLAFGKESFNGYSSSEQLKQVITSRGAVDISKIEEEELMMLFLMAA